MTLKSVIVHPFLPASSNGRIASTRLTSDSPICPTCLFQTLTVARNEFKSYIEAFFQSLKAGCPKIQQLQGSVNGHEIDILREGCVGNLSVCQNHKSFISGEKLGKTTVKPRISLFTSRRGNFRNFGTVHLAVGLWK
ncbi:hypothetical protein TNCV_4631801 [Trichonephila clavipes]|nr:hypothetical protein TNCV_4631801 [Trichonephila clavipes]